MRARPTPGTEAGSPGIAPRRTPDPVDPHALTRLLMRHDFVDVDVELAPLLTRPEWHQHAACRGTSVDDWFPTRGQGRPAADLLALCHRCPVHDRCAEVGATEPVGWWAGTSPKQRRRASTEPPHQ